MWTKQRKIQRKLLYEILASIGMCFASSLVLYLFITRAGRGLVDWYCLYHGLSLSEFEYYRMDRLVYGVGFLVSAICFSILFFVMFGDKLAYIRKITDGVHAMQKGTFGLGVELIGNNELTELAEAINYLAESEKKIKEKEKHLQEEREAFIRTLSHDIRTPLTSIISYTELLSQKGQLTREEQREYLSLVSKKTAQMKELTDILLDGGKREVEFFADARLLFEQLACEFEEELEETFKVSVIFMPTAIFAGNFDVRELQRIFDNLISNIKKYAEPTEEVMLTISVAEHNIEICQRNGIRKDKPESESYRMGIQSIRRIAHHYGGGVEIAENKENFQISIKLSTV